MEHHKKKAVEAYLNPSGLYDAIRAAKRVFLVGNGGSYANCQHVQNDLLGCGIAAFTLDPATLTAFANDYGYENVFALWLEKVGTAGDLLIAMSGSGKSPNILHAISTAERLGMNVYRIFGNERGESMQEAEEAQIILGHDVMRRLRCKT